MTQLHAMPAELARAFRAITDEQAAREPDVAAAQRARDERERARLTAYAQVQHAVQQVSRLDAELAAARARLEQLEGGYPSIAARVILDELDTDAETTVLNDIAEAQRVIRRCEAARPLIEARAEDPRRRHALIAAEVLDLDAHLAEVTHVARERLARQALGWT
jgi:predicted  nucleic acid-binding Zn-ribbon protein